MSAETMTVRNDKRRKKNHQPSLEYKILDTDVTSLCIYC